MFKTCPLYLSKVITILCVGKIKTLSEFTNQSVSDVIDHGYRQNTPCIDQIYLCLKLVLPLLISLFKGIIIFYVCWENKNAIFVVFTNQSVQMSLIMDPDFETAFSSVAKKNLSNYHNCLCNTVFWRIFCFVYKSIGSDVIELLSSLIMDPDIETASMYDSRTRFLLSGPPPPGLVAIPGPRGPLPMLSTEDRVLLEPWFRRATTPFWRPEKTAKN